MDSEQQSQALEYFRKVAADWRRKAETASFRAVNVIEQRNQYVLTVARERARLERTLDVGCGTGELVCALAGEGALAVGVDFAPEMIALCEEKKAKEGVARAEFVCASIFEYLPGPHRFDLISANGFIEYISRAALGRFLALVRDALAPGGSVVVGSRNRLFNAFSLNAYTVLEREIGALDALLDECLAIAGAEAPADCIAVLEGLGRSLPAVAAHPTTGIDVATRHQYTPAELVQLFGQFGLKTLDLYPVHYHAAIPRFGRDHPEVHAATAALMQEFARGAHFLLPSASSFMVHALRQG
jgi:2-polyprenyl-3-methyl-5-hydroxy-6-metoxy-1,4-benzoquinol methylase